MLRFARENPSVKRHLDLQDRKECVPIQGQIDCFCLACQADPCRPLIENWSWFAKSSIPVSADSVRAQACQTRLCLTICYGVTVVKLQEDKDDDGRGSRRGSRKGLFGLF